MEKRAKHHPLLPKLAIGLCAGCVAATALLFPLDLVLRAFQIDRYRYLEHALLAAWFVAIAASLLHASWSRMPTWLLCIGAAFLAVGAAGSLLIALPRYWSGSADAARAGIDVGILLVALAIYVSARLARKVAPEGRAVCNVG